MAGKVQEACLGIERRQITELKSFAAPPQAVKDVCIALSVLCADNMKSDWATARKTLGSFHRLISAFDVNNVDPERKQIAKELIAGLSEDDVKKTNVVAVVIFKFVQAVCTE